MSVAKLFAFIIIVTMVSDLSSSFQGKSINEDAPHKTFFFLLKE